jgi:hypothetical protein
MKARMARRWKRNGTLAREDCGDFLVASEPAHDLGKDPIELLASGTKAGLCIVVLGGMFELCASLIWPLSWHTHLPFLTPFLQCCFQGSTSRFGAYRGFVPHLVTGAILLAAARASTPLHDFNPTASNCRTAPVPARTSGYTMESSGKGGDFHRPPPTSPKGHPKKRPRREWAPRARDDAQWADPPRSPSA